MNRHREPRGGRSLPFAVSKERAPRRELGRPLSFAISKERKQIMGRATAATHGRGYQLRAAPTPLTEQAIAAPPCEIRLLLVVFLPSVFALVLRF
jgi:hypothetical protein